MEDDDVLSSLLRRVGADPAAAALIDAYSEPKADVAAPASPSFSTSSARRRAADQFAVTVTAATLESIDCYHDGDSDSGNHDDNASGDSESHNSSEESSPSRGIAGASASVEASPKARRFSSCRRESNCLPLRLEAESDADRTTGPASAAVACEALAEHLPCQATADSARESLTTETVAQSSGIRPPGRRLSTRLASSSPASSIRGYQCTLGSAADGAAAASAAAASAAAAEVILDAQAAMSTAAAGVCTQAEAEAGCSESEPCFKSEHMSSSDIHWQANSTATRMQSLRLPVEHVESACRRGRSAGSEEHFQVGVTHWQTCLSGVADANGSRQDEDDVASLADELQLDDLLDATTAAPRQPIADHHDADGSEVTVCHSKPVRRGTLASPAQLWKPAAQARLSSCWSLAAAAEPEGAASKSQAVVTAAGAQLTSRSLSPSAAAFIAVHLAASASVATGSASVPVRQRDCHEVKAISEDALDVMIGRLHTGGLPVRLVGQHPRAFKFERPSHGDS